MNEVTIWQKEELDTIIPSEEKRAGVRLTGKKQQPKELHAGDAFTRS